MRLRYAPALPGLLLLLLVPAAATAQAAPPAADSTDAALRARWAEPFAVASVGHLPARETRSVVVDSGTVAAPPPAPAPPLAPAPKPRVPAKPAAPAAVRTHRVEWGETFFGIARQYSVSPAELRALNPSVDPDRLLAGTVLVVPAPAGRATARQRYVVQDGDTLWGIAHRFGVSPAEVMKANGLKNDVVRVGQTLVIPQGGER
ncbi:MAG TPA: LysM peptidoglycan-binding domain-containing protein [Longimicrobiaceae bacterium]|nr:LysM peptidoglycan-binding domain-containing protein [Longimicrobiaceae bacterium]